jgi:hypothetical protein
MIAGLLQKVRNSSEIADCTSQAAMTYIYRWDRQGRKGQRCKVLARGTMNSCCVEFEDGYTMVTSRNALKRASAREATVP